MVATANDLSFPRRARIIKTDDFSSVFNFRKRVSGKFLVIHYQHTELSSPRLGLVVAKKITQLSVRRNYIKRVLRELFRMHRKSAGLGNIDLIVRTQKTFVRADFPIIKKEFEDLLIQLRSQIKPFIAKQQLVGEK